MVALAPLATCFKSAALVLAVLELLLPEFTLKLHLLDLLGESLEVGLSVVRLDLEDNAGLANRGALVAALLGVLLGLGSGGGLGLGGGSKVFAGAVIVVVTEETVNARVTVVTLRGGGGGLGGSADGDGEASNGRGLGALVSGEAGDVVVVACEVRVLGSVGGGVASSLRGKERGGE